MRITTKQGDTTTKETPESKEPERPLPSSAEMAAGMRAARPVEDPFDGVAEPPAGLGDLQRLLEQLIPAVEHERVIRENLSGNIVAVNTLEEEVHPVRPGNAKRIQADDSKLPTAAQRGRTLFVVLPYGIAMHGRGEDGLPRKRVFLPWSRIRSVELG